MNIIQNDEDMAPVECIVGDNCQKQLLKLIVKKFIEKNQRYCLAEEIEKKRRNVK